MRSGQDFSVAMEGTALKWLISVLSGLFYVEPELFWGVALLFAFNTVAGAWMTADDPDERVGALLSDTWKRALVYVIGLASCIVLSQMISVLEVLRVTAFGVVAAWETVATAGTLARVYPPFTPIYRKLADWISDKTPLAPTHKEMEEHLNDDVDRTTDDTRPNGAD